MSRSRVPLFLLFLVSVSWNAARADLVTSAPPPGLRENTPAVHALTGARIVLAPGRVVRKGTLVIRDGVIAAVGADTRPPADAVVRDMSGKTLYAGFISAYAAWGAPSSRASSARDGAPYWNRWVTPQHRAEDGLAIDTAAVRELREQGFAACLVAPRAGVIRGTSAVIALGEGPAGATILKQDAALHVSFLPPERPENEVAYPTSPMGAYTLVRQALYDADWYARAQAAWLRDRTLPRPETNEALDALQGYAGGRRLVIAEASNELYALRADRLAREFGLRLVLRGSGREYRRLDAVRAAGRAVIVPLGFPGTPPVETPESAASVTLEELMHWDLAPENPGRLARAGIPIAFTTEGLPDSVTFLGALRKAVERGLSPDAALKALTLTPASLVGMGDRLGTLDAGRMANVVVTDGDLFDRNTKVHEVWVDGRRYDVIPRPASDPRGEWRVRIPLPDGPPLTLTIRGSPGEKLSGTIRRAAEAKLSGVEALGTRISLRFAGDSLGLRGVVTMSAAFSDSEMTGLGALGDGVEFPWSARRVAPYAPPPDTARAPAPVGASFPVNTPLGEFGRAAPPEQPRAVVFRGATIWTCGPAGVIERGSVLVERGRITAVGRDVTAPAGAVVVDGTGRHLTPGLIDCHSHAASDGGINEAGQTVSAEVRIGDFIDPDDIDIYRHLAGGVTTEHILHGSSNTIGGQNQLLKTRWGAGPEEMKFDGAPPTIKFALGENVKQSNWGDAFTTRYPQTRMGVEQLLRDEFRAARDYERAWSEWEARKRGIPPRRDLELDAVVEVLNGKRRVHCHSYRQDEILMFLRLCDDFGIRNVTFQHVLEGYKVADEIARRGFGASTFSDWWAYKLEVYDGIPENGALMQEAGVVVSFNSDSQELARRLNAEAGKARKYGGLSDPDALKLVTINPAIQLGIQSRVGSIEAGKDADLALWSGPPLSTFSRCDQTWIEGRKYFDRDEDRRAREEAAARRAVLVQKALAAGMPEARVKPAAAGRDGR